ncbi:SRPBCC family protein [Halovivax limisalsi]|uniref:SRPBCC family protein n=1 Tax=Halovivax limisalsi TaxID=1453760 RepID=UPI001FFCB500|nr:SRPBCC family protein [Halovivax limisalsi]
MSFYRTDAATDTIDRIRDAATEIGDARSLPTRAGLAAVGGILLARGLQRRSLGGALTAGVGGYAIYRALATSESTAIEDATAGETGLERARSHDFRAATDRPGIERSITIDESADELAALVDDPETIDRLVGPVASVEPIDGDPDWLRWTVTGPRALTATWELELLAEQPGSFSRWRSTDGSVLPVEYSLTFQEAPADRGTEVTLRLWLDPPGGRLGTAVVDRLLARDVLASTALYRLKSLAETGEIPTLDGNVSARGRGDLV